MPDIKQQVRTPFSPQELEKFRERLLEEQQNAQEEVERLKASIKELDQQHDDEKSSIDHHLGDLGGDEETRQMDYTLIERNLKKIGEINAAIERIDNGKFGICEETGEFITKERLEMIPWTRYSLKAQKHREGDL